MSIAKVSNPTLLSGLEQFVKVIMGMHPNTIMSMCTWHNSPIGLGLDIDTVNSQVELIRDYFGIDIQNMPPQSFIFSKTKSPLLTQEQWQVIRLFTNAVGDEISVQDWLNLARTVLKKLHDKQLGVNRSKAEIPADIKKLCVQLMIIRKKIKLQQFIAQQGETVKAIDLESLQMDIKDLINSINTQ